MNQKRKKKIPQLSNDKLTIEYDVNEFSQNLPNLANELANDENPGRLHIKEVAFEDGVPDDPGVNDFIQRCNTVEEALEIVEYLKKRKEITPEVAQKCIQRLKSKGLSDFGPHRDPGYYEQTFRRNRKFKQV